MDFEKASFLVDWFTPGDKYGPKRLSFPKSACISMDDLVNVSDSPLSFCFSPVDEAPPMPRTHSVVDSSFERACGWTNSAPPSPFVPSDREPDQMYEQDPKACEESPTDWCALPSPGLLSIADDCASCGVELDVSCLEALDEQLLVSPVDCFTELCWAAAVHDDMTAPIPRRSMRTRARSFKGDRERAFSPPAARDYPGSFERPRPLAAKIALPLDKYPHWTPSPLSARPYDAYPGTPSACALHADPKGRPHQDLPTPRPVKKRDGTLLPPSSVAPSRQQPPMPPPRRLRTSKSSHALRVLTDVCASPLARPRKKSPLVAP